MSDGMKKIMRNKVFVTKMTVGILMALFLMGSMLMAGCKSSEKQNAAADNFWHYTWDKDVIGKTGLFYFDGPYMRFFDGESGIDVVVCDKASCDHDDEDCSAYFDGSVRIPILVESSLQLVTDLGADTQGDLSLYECDINGENRKKITDLFASMQFVNDAIWTDKLIILAYENKYDAEYNDLEKTQAGIFVYNRQDQIGEVIWLNENYHASTSGLELSENLLCFRYSYSLFDNEIYNRLFDSGDIEKIINGICAQEYAVDLETGDVTLVTEDKPSSLTWSTENGGVYVIFDAKRLEYWPTLLGAREERVTLLEGDIVEQFDSFVDGMQYFGVYHNDTGKKEAYVYDEMSKELTNLGDITDYGVRAIFADRVYLWDYTAEDGYGVRAVMPYDAFMQGDYTKVIRSDHSDAEG